MMNAVLVRLNPLRIRERFRQPTSDYNKDLEES